MTVQKSKIPIKRRRRKIPWQYEKLRPNRGGKKKQQTTGNKIGNTGNTQGLRNRHRSPGDAGDTGLINQQRGRKQQRLKDEVQVQRHWGQGSTNKAV